MSPQKLPYEVINENSHVPVVLLCEHASPSIPAELNNLGLAADTFAKEPEMFFDPGASEVTREIAKQLGCYALLGVNSRLVVDLNRAATHPHLMAGSFHGYDVPANKALSANERSERIARYFTPFHEALEQKIQSLKQHGVKPILFTTHSFSAHNAEIYRHDPSVKRIPLDISLLYSFENSCSRFFSERLQRQTQFAVVDNHPYDLRKLKVGTVYDMGQRHGLEGIGIEMDSAKTADAAWLNGVTALIKNTIKAYLDANQQSA